MFEFIGKTAKAVITTASDVVTGVINVPAEIKKGYDEGFKDDKKEKPKSDK